MAARKLGTDQVNNMLAGYGLQTRGCLQPSLEDGLPDSVAELLLVGHAGSRIWPVFSQSPEYQDGQPDPLDRWSRRVGSAIAGDLGADVVFPFGGPPYYPFVQWAVRAEAIAPSRLGMLIHPEFGLWHAYRFALLLPETLATSAGSAFGGQPEVSDICAACAHADCLRACPVNAFSLDGYDVHACGDYLVGDSTVSCHSDGCAARLACPEGESYCYEREHMAFHMRAFTAARRSG